MNRPPIRLSPEITRANALAMMDWLKDPEVTRYLSDSRHVSRDIERVVNRVHLPTLTHLFNQGGRFFMVHDGPHDRPIGFVRLVHAGADHEMVIVIGERSNWGRKLGTSTLQLGLKAAFHELRASRLIARIHPGNVWSIRAFRNCGFELHAESPALQTYELTRERYFALPRHIAASAPDVRITQLDRERLRKLIAAAQRRDNADHPMLTSLACEIDRAIVVPAQQVAPDVITMNSRARLRVNDEPAEISVVYPEQADRRAGRVSVFSPVGTAVLGFREGDRVDWLGPEGPLTIQIEKVVYQPEAAGDFHL